MTDVTGVSGTGRVAEGVEFSNKMCALIWCTSVSSVAVYKNIEDLEKIHGHQGSTKVVIDSTIPQSGLTFEEGYRFPYDNVYVMCRMVPYVKISIIHEREDFVQYITDNDLDWGSIEESTTET